MTLEIKYPYQLTEAFFISLRIEREPEIPEELKINFPAKVKVQDNKFPKTIQVNLKLETDSTGPLTMCLELVGIFNFVEGQPEPDRALIQDFVNNRALFMLWPYMDNVLKQITAQMGMSPLKLKTPYHYEFIFSSLEPESVAGEID